MFFITLFAAFVAFPESNEAVFTNNKKDVLIETNGNYGFFYKSKCNPTNGNETLLSDEKSDWCSTIVKSDEKPFIQYSLKNKKVKVTKYSVRNGCCHFLCCSTDTGNMIQNQCCCELYCYSLLGSNDNRTWVTLHKVENDESFFHCKAKTFEITNTKESFKYFRFVLDKEYPNSPNCLQINQIELYGEVIKAESDDFEDDSYDDDETISIIGKVNRRL